MHPLDLICNNCSESGHKKVKCPLSSLHKEVIECPIENNISFTEGKYTQVGEMDYGTQNQCHATESNTTEYLFEQKQSLIESESFTDICINAKNENKYDGNNYTVSECIKEGISVNEGEISVQKDSINNKVCLTENRSTERCEINQGAQEEETGVQKDPIANKEYLTECIPRGEINQETQKKYQIKDRNITEDPLEGNQTLIKSKSFADVRNNDNNEGESKHDNNNITISECFKVKGTVTEEEANVRNDNERNNSIHCNPSEAQTGKRPASEHQDSPILKKLKGSDECYFCGESGHKRFNCPNNKAKYKVKRDVQSGTKITADPCTDINEKEDQNNTKSNDASDHKTVQDNRLGSPGNTVRFLLRNTPKFWTQENITNFLQYQCKIPTSQLKKIVLMNDKKRSWGVELESAYSIVDIKKIIKDVGTVDGRKVFCTVANDNAAEFTTNVITINQFIETRLPSMPYAAFSKDFLPSKIKQRQEETYGLNEDFLKHLNITVPLTSSVFVKNLPEHVTEQKLREVFGIAGHVVSLAMHQDYSLLSAHIEYEHPVEAVQAISMLHGQKLFGIKINVHQNKFPNKGLLLPEGLSGVGMGLGHGGKPLRDVWDMMELVAVKQKLAEVTSQLCEQKSEENVAYSPSDVPTTLEDKVLPYQMPPIPINIPPPSQLNVPPPPLNQSAAPLFQMNMPPNQMGIPQFHTVPQNPMDMLAHYPMVIPQNHIDASLSQMNVLPFDIHMQQYCMNVPHNQINVHHQTEVPLNQPDIPLHQMTQSQQHVLPIKIDLTKEPDDARTRMTVPRGQQNKLTAFPIKNDLSKKSNNAPSSQLANMSMSELLTLSKRQSTGNSSAQIKGKQIMTPLKSTSTSNTVNQSKAVSQLKPVSQPKSDIPLKTRNQLNSVKKFMAAIETQEILSSEDDDLMPEYNRKSRDRSKESSSSDDDDSYLNNKRSSGKERNSRSSKDDKSRCDDLYYKSRRSDSDKSRRSDFDKSRRSDFDKSRRSDSDYKSRRSDSDYKSRRSDSDYKSRRSDSDYKSRHSEADNRSRRSNSENTSKEIDVNWKTNEISDAPSSEILLFENLPLSVTEEALRKKMNEVGEVKYVKTKGDGRAFVSFKEKPHSERCYKFYDGSKVDGHTIIIKRIV